MRRPLFQLLGSATLGAALILGTNAIAKDKDKSDDTRQQRMEHDKWTNADRARDVLDHLKKAQTELDNITNESKEGPAAQALHHVKEAIVQVDKYLEQVDKKK